MAEEVNTQGTKEGAELDVRMPLRKQREPPNEYYFVRNDIGKMFLIFQAYR